MTRTSSLCLRQFIAWSKLWTDITRVWYVDACCFCRLISRAVSSTFRARVCVTQCELDIMFNLEKAHFIVDEMFMNGCIVETNKANILKPVVLLDKLSR